MPGGPRAGRLPGPRGDRRRRRLDRRTRRAIAAEYDVRLISQAEPRASAPRATPAGRRATGEIVAYLDDDAYPDPRLAQVPGLVASSRPHYAAIGGPNITPPDDPPVSHAVGHAPGGPIHVLAVGHRGRAHPGLQHGVPARGARGDRRLRPDLPGRGRRRRRLLADPARGVDDRLQPRRGGLAPPAAIGPRVLAAAAGLRPGRGPARAEVAREVQRPRARRAGRAPCTAARCSGASAVRAGRIYHGIWGSGAVPVPLPAVARGPERGAAHARVVPGDRDAHRPRPPGARVAAAPGGAAARRPGSHATLAVAITRGRAPASRSATGGNADGSPR